MHPYDTLKFTPLEFETVGDIAAKRARSLLKFTPLEFETTEKVSKGEKYCLVKIYSVGVWNFSSSW